MHQANCYGMGEQWFRFPAQILADLPLRNATFIGNSRLLNVGVHQRFNHFFDVHARDDIPAGMWTQEKYLQKALAHVFRMEYITSIASINQRRNEMLATVTKQSDGYYVRTYESGPNVPANQPQQFRRASGPNFEQGPMPKYKAIEDADRINRYA